MNMKVLSISLVLLPILLLAGRGPVSAAAAAAAANKTATPPMCYYSSHDPVIDLFWPVQSVPGFCGVNPAWFNAQKVSEIIKRSIALHKKNTR